MIDLTTAPPTSVSVGGGLFTGFSRLCKGLSTLLVLAYLVVLVFPPAIDYIALVPGKTIPFAWNLLSAGYLEQFFYGSSTGAGAGAVRITTIVAVGVRVLLIVEQIRWDSKDSQAHAVIALSIKREVIPNHSLVQTVLDALSESYQTFASTWRLVTEDKLDAVRYDTLVSNLLYEVQSKQNRARQRAVDQAFVVAQ
ncbi:hypothetical protein L7F22_010424 [Adiantum nelumboides]|nr:hypothetical protein [Adiantum nelumboides]